MAVTRFLLVTLMLLLIGCTKSVMLLNSNVQTVSGNNISLLIETDQDLAALNNSMWAHHIYLKYKVKNTSVINEIENISYDTLEFPFLAFNISLSEACNINTGTYCSLWEIPLHSNNSISGRKYQYSIKSASNNLITVRIGGGNMVCCFLESNEHNIEVEH